jgi:oxygen-independent coproporphyrinogen-3 oxidase
MRRCGEISDRIKMAKPQGGFPGLYVHVPFCKTKCPYCDFYSVTDSTSEEAWLQGLLVEMSLYKNSFGTFDTVYLGGGTPTVLKDTTLTSLFDGLFRQFNIASDAEITVEANPDDATSGRLALLKSLGVNRLSVGVQSFNTEELRFLQRRHSARGAEDALRNARESGFSNIGIDLMYGLPGQILESWLGTLGKALTFQPTHMSCYQLTIEKSTVFGRMNAKGHLHGLSEEAGRRFFLATSRFLKEHGFIHYEISNFARSKEYYSRHNRKYWQHIPYLGLGPGAHSFQGGERWWNTNSIEHYSSSLQKEIKPVEASERLSPDQERLERILLGLRTQEGVALEDVLGTSKDKNSLVRLKKSGFVRVSQNRVSPTKKGFLIADRLPLILAQ